MHVWERNGGVEPHVCKEYAMVEPHVRKMNAVVELLMKYPHAQGPVVAPMHGLHGPCGEFILMKFVMSFVSIFTFRLRVS